MPAPMAARFDLLDKSGKVVKQSQHGSVQLAWLQAFRELDSVADKAGEDGTEKRYEDFWDEANSISAGSPGEIILNDSEGRPALLFKVETIR